MLMKALIHSRYGNPEVLQVVSLERPVPRKNEVLVRVIAAGLDYTPTASSAATATPASSRRGWTTASWCR